MTTRMDRYYEEKNSVKRRSERNQMLYRDIYENGDYSNIEGIATLKNQNEIDINKVKQMLKNREDYLNQKNNNQSIIKPLENPKLQETEEKNYDIREILNNAKTNRTAIDEHKSISNTSYDIFKDLREKRRRELDNLTDEESNTLKKLINTISTTSMLNSMTDKELSLDLLDDLKSTGNTIYTDNDSIKKLIDEVKEKENVKEQKQEVDRSFYTSSLGFKQEDFEELSDLKNNIKTNNTLIKIILSILTLAFLAGAIVLVFMLLK